MKYAFIERHRRLWPISVQCRMLKVSMAGYHEHFVRSASAEQRRHLSDDTLLVHIKVIHTQTRGGCGWPRTWKELLARGIRVGKDRVQKLMQLHGIRAKAKRRFKVTTDSRHDLPIAANLLNRDFTVTQPDTVWVGDITYIPTDEGWLYLAVVIDLFSRQRGGRSEVFSWVGGGSAGAGNLGGREVRIQPPSLSKHLLRAAGIARMCCSQVGDQGNRPWRDGGQGTTSAVGFRYE